MLKLVAGMLVALIAAGPVEAATAIRCTGEAGADWEAIVPATRIYVIDDETRTVSLFNPKSGGKVEVCGDCAKDFGSQSIRLVKNYTGAWEELRIDREKGTLWYYLAGLRGIQGRHFNGTCEKTVLPKTATRTRKF